MTTHSILRYATLEPDLINLVASFIDAHASLIVIDARKDKIDATSRLTSLKYSLLELVILSKTAYVHIVDLYLDIRVDLLERQLGSFNFRKALVAGQVEHAIHIRKLHTIVVVHDELTNATSCEHFSDNGANTSDTNDQNCKVSDLSVISDDS